MDKKTDKILEYVEHLDSDLLLPVCSASAFSASSVASFLFFAAENAEVTEEN